MMNNEQQAEQIANLNDEELSLVHEIMVKAHTAAWDDAQQWLTYYAIDVDSKIGNVINTYLDDVAMMINPYSMEVLNRGMQY